MSLSPYQEFIFLRSYSRYREDLGRRETWDEAVDRLKGFWLKRIPKVLEPDLLDAIESFRRLEVMPSMRTVWSAGEALEKNNAAAYNCAYVPLESPKDLADMMFILMSGGGVGFSVERKYVERWSPIPYNLHENPNIVITIDDSKEGWADSVVELFNWAYKGILPAFDYSKIRPAGAIIKTFGGYASGPEPLRQLHEFIKTTLMEARGRRLTSLELYDIATHVANCVVSGGSRRSATISFSDFDDLDMRHAKDGPFWDYAPNRALSNNTAVLPVGISHQDFLEEYKHTVDSKVGERGFLFLESVLEDILVLHRDPSYDYRLNPCGEVILRPRQFCNLSEIVVRPDDTLESLINKAKKATLFGVLQASLTDFVYLDPRWKTNSEDERLLGVSMTGTRDHPILQRTSKEAMEWLSTLRKVVWDMSKYYSGILGINAPKSVTSIKPSGTVSQLTGTASGIHPRFAPYYKRRVIVNKYDPIAQVLIEQGIEHEESIYNQNAYVFTFYQKSPETSVFAKDVDAHEQLVYWSMYKNYYTTHNPSYTLVYKPEEVESLGAMLYNYKPTGLTILPQADSHYEQLPFEEITKEEYLKGLERQKKANLGQIQFFLNSDSGEPGCSGGACLY